MPDITVLYQNHLGGKVGVKSLQQMQEMTEWINDSLPDELKDEMILKYVKIEVYTDEYRKDTIIIQTDEPDLEERIAYHIKPSV